MSGNKSQVGNRDAIRAAIFGAKAEVRTILFFGQEIELRQPQLGVILETREEDAREAGIQMLLGFAYVPGTDDKVFGPEDEDIIRQLPMGPDLTRLFKVCSELLGADSEGLNNQIDGAVKSPEAGSPAVSGNGDSAGDGEG